MSKKLRVWLKNKNKMIYLEEEEYMRLTYDSFYGWRLMNLYTPTNTPEVIAEEEDIIIMYFIGITDINHKKIYEYDIIKKENKVGTKYYLIKYNNDRGAFVMKRLNRTRHSSIKPGTEISFSAFRMKKSEVVGNKYNDKQLLKEVKNEKLC